MKLNFQVNLLTINVSEYTANGFAILTIDNYHKERSLLSIHAVNGMIWISILFFNFQFKNKCST